MKCSASTGLCALGLLQLICFRPGIFVLKNHIVVLDARTQSSHQVNDMTQEVILSLSSLGEVVIPRFSGSLLLGTEYRCESEWPYFVASSKARIDRNPGTASLFES